MDDNYSASDYNKLTLKEVIAMGVGGMAGSGNFNTPEIPATLITRPGSSRTASPPLMDTSHESQCQTRLSPGLHHVHLNPDRVGITGKYCCIDLENNHDSEHPSPGPATDS